MIQKQATELMLLCHLTDGWYSFPLNLNLKSGILDADVLGHVSVHRLHSIYNTCPFLCIACSLSMLRSPESSTLLQRFAEAGAFWETGSSFFVGPEDDALQLLLHEGLASRLVTRISIHHIFNHIHIQFEYHWLSVLVEYFHW